MLDLNFFQDKNSPQKFVLVNGSCQKPNFVPYIIKEWLLKILTHPKMGICKGAPGLLSIITGNFAQFVNTTGGWCFERQVTYSTLNSLMFHLHPSILSFIFLAFQYHLIHCGHFHHHEVLNSCLETTFPGQNCLRANCSGSPIPTFPLDSPDPLHQLLLLLGHHPLPHPEAQGGSQGGSVVGKVAKSAQFYILLWQKANNGLRSYLVK